LRPILTLSLSTARAENQSPYTSGRPPLGVDKSAIQKYINMDLYKHMDEVKKLARVFKAFSDETRLRLVKTLAELRPDDALCVNALAAMLGVSQPAVSQHLAVLRAADLVIGERRGYHVHYRLSLEGVAAYRAQAFALLGEEFMASPVEETSAARAAGRRLAGQGEDMRDERRATARSGHCGPS